MLTEGVATFLSILGSPFFFRYMTPALIVSWALIPLIPAPWTHLVYLPALGLHIPIPVLTLWRFLVYVVGIFSIGFILRGIYPVHMGMLMGVLLPQGLRALAIGRLERHVLKAQAIIASVSTSIAVEKRSRNPLRLDRNRRNLLQF